MFDNQLDIVKHEKIQKLNQRQWSLIKCHNFIDRQHKSIMSTPMLH